MHQADSNAIKNPPSAETPSAAGVYSIYEIRRRSDGRRYVGVTQRPLELRKRLHIYCARRRTQVPRPGGLGEAILRAERSGLSAAVEFEITLLETCTTPLEARRLEALWIERLKTRVPNGFNLQPGGATLGGPGNARPITLGPVGQAPQVFQSIMSALAATNATREANGEKALRLPAVYARLQAGHAQRAAFGLTQRLDLRRKRAEPFRYRGRTHVSLHTVSSRKNIPIDTLRSRLHRARLAGIANADIGFDRRLPGSPRRNDAGTGRLPPLSLPHPKDAEAPPVSAAEFARLTGIPKATVTHRFNRVLAGDFGDPAALTRQQILNILIQKTERRIVIALPVPDGRVLHGGVRELIRHLFSQPRLLAVRHERLGPSAIRARLRKLPRWPLPAAAGDISWAFGFNPSRG
ncbi:MAG: hypothetical protein ING00_14090 [Roseomonas sp.]|nr:hypothetical protein [Roseomonas sp.]